MPVRIHCPSCQSPVTAPDHLAGKSAKCPRCQTAMTIPGGSPSVASVPATAPEPQRDLDFGDAAVASRTRQTGGPEPWFIWFAELFANVCGFLFLAGCFIRFVIDASTASKLEREGYLLPLAFGLGLQLAVILFCWALMLIFVDIARSLRVLCRQGERR